MTVRALFAAAVIASSLSASAAGAQEPAAGEARDEFVAGLRAAEELRWDRALEHFRRSYEIAPTSAALYNAATTLRALGRHLEARDALERLLEAHELEPDVRAAAEQMLAEERTRLATLVLLELPAPAVSIRVDGVRRADPGERPLEVEADAGERRLAIEHPGHEPFFWTGTLAEGERREVAVALETARGSDETWYESPWLFVAGGVVIGAIVVVAVLAASGGTELEPRTNLVLRP